MQNICENMKIHWNVGKTIFESWECGWSAAEGTRPGVNKNGILYAIIAEECWENTNNLPEILDKVC